MSNSKNYLYDNTYVDAGERLQGLERIEDVNTISLLSTLPIVEGQRCLEVGAGAGSIAEWLAKRVGGSGSVVAIDIEPAHLHSSNYEIRQHNVETDWLPADEFDLVHFRHLLIHLSQPQAALRKLSDSLKLGGLFVAEESDLGSWSLVGGVTEQLRKTFQSGIDAVFDIYRSRGMDIEIGSKLVAMLGDAGCTVEREQSHRRIVDGGSPEAIFQSMSALQLATSVASNDLDLSERLIKFSECFREPDLRYQSRTTVSVSAFRGR